MIGGGRCNDNDVRLVHAQRVSHRLETLCLVRRLEERAALWVWINPDRRSKGRVEAERTRVSADVAGCGTSDVVVQADCTKSYEQDPVGHESPLRFTF